MQITADTLDMHVYNIVWDLKGLMKISFAQINCKQIEFYLEKILNN